MTGWMRASWQSCYAPTKSSRCITETMRTRALKELGRSYMTITKDGTRVMNRIKSVYRSWGIPCAGTSVYSRRHRAQWLAQLVEPGVRIRAEHLYQQLDSLQPLCLEARHQLLRES